MNSLLLEEAVVRNVNDNKPILSIMSFKEQ